MKTILAVTALALSSACASTMSSGTSAVAENGSCSPATADRGAIVYSSPDETSKAVATISDRTQVCADAASVGFGFRHVKLSDGREGYIADSQLM